METLETICRMTQKELFENIIKQFPGLCKVKKNKWILVKGNYPVLLVSHLDTVHTQKVEVICRSSDGNILMSPQGIGGDDRCGVYALLTIWNNLKSEGIHPYLLFTCHEEIGGIGAKYFIKSDCINDLKNKLSLIIEIDRKGKDNAVYYDCDNKGLENYITSKGFNTQYGSFSDISVIAPALGIAAVNLSSGYYNAHTQHEYINVIELENVIEKVEEIICESKGLPVYEYIEKKYNYNWNFGKTLSPYYSKVFPGDDILEKYITKYEGDLEKQDMIFGMMDNELEIFDILTDYYNDDDLFKYIKNCGYDYSVLLDLYNDTVLDNERK